MKYEPREYQTRITEHIKTHPRCNVYASPGMGKTVAVLSSLEKYPVLVVAPLRVANSVWPREVARWAHTEHLRVSKILGTAKEREKALRIDADIYVIHYGLLKWLEAQKYFPFKHVIADESTRLKNARSSLRTHPKTGKVHFYKGGGVHAAALARLSLGAMRWTNLSGTPAPNGLKDLWGQHWFTDRGRALGNTFTAFTYRWFTPARGTRPEHQVFVPMAHAFGEITDRMAVNTISLDAYDYFDCAKPREVDIKIELPAKALALYKQMEQEAFMQIAQDVRLNAANAGVAIAKCMQIASGNVYGEDKQAIPVHEAKLDALESLQEELQGAPLIVAYHFKSDLAAIQKRFPAARVLPSGGQQQEVEDAWNRGEIPLLLVHPASAGHGLNLQYGGHNMCIYTPYWDLEMYQQIIERIGPVRQMQAGLKREVNIYRLVAEKTLDEVMVNQVLKRKATLQDALLERLK